MTGLALWLSTRPWVKYAAAGFLAVYILAGIYAVIITVFNRSLETASEAGAATERAIAAEKGLKNVEAAAKARDDVRGDVDNARYDECLRSARTPANCERYLLPER